MSKLFFVNLLGGFPDFFIGILLLLIFAVSLDVLPLSGATSPYAGYEGLAYVSDILRHLALPLAAMVLVQLGGIFLLTRNTIVTLLGESFILAARAKGCPEKSIKYAHAGRNSLLPVTTYTGLRIPHLITGALSLPQMRGVPGKLHGDLRQNGERKDNLQGMLPEDDRLSKRLILAGLL